MEAEGRLAEAGMAARMDSVAVVRLAGIRVGMEEVEGMEVEGERGVEVVMGKVVRVLGS